MLTKLALWLSSVTALVILPITPLISSVQIAANLPFFTTVAAALGDDYVPTTNSTGMRLDGWIYPDNPGALEKLRIIGRTNVVRAEFMHVNDDGSLQQINQDQDHPNGYSPGTAQIMADHSDQRYITVSGAMEGTQLAMQNSEQTISQLVNFANKISFGIELDWEQFGAWTPEYYQQYKSFVSKLADALHDNKHYLILDGPPIYDANSQNWYQFKYEDLTQYANYLTMMVYDNQYDTGVGNAIAPTDWSAQCLRWLKDKAGTQKGIPGLAAYGYIGDTASGDIKVNTSGYVSQSLKNTLGTTNLSGEVTRNSSGELTRTVDGTFYDFSDQKTVYLRLKQAQDMGFIRAAFWSLGENPWPN